MYTIPCQNCKGKGKIDHYKHVEDGICFTCYGSGVQEVTEEVYNDYQEFQERIKQGSYILFNNGAIEYYKTEKEIESKYGNFYSGSYGGWSVAQSYKNENIVYKRHTESSDEFIKAFKEEFKTINTSKLNDDIKRLKNMLKLEKDTEWIKMLKEKITELKTQLTSL
jgi:hypothetical protein